MHGLGNDFVVFDAREQAIPMTPSRAKAIADRHFGVGCDTRGRDHARATPQADARLRFFNADGGEVESCGNATRCVARLLMDERGLARVKLDSKGGLLVCSDAGKGLVTVDMGAPNSTGAIFPWPTRSTPTNFHSLDVGGNDLPPAPSLMGNPHCVLFVADAEHAPVRRTGPQDRDPSPLSHPHQCRIRPGAGSAAISACGCGNAAWA